MECAGRDLENREGAKFCKNCGAELECVCPSCGRSCESDSSLCDQCGHDLNGPREAHSKERSFDKKLARIQKYLPTGLAEKIVSQRDKIEGERRQVTVMFCDMADFTPLMEKREPAEAYSIDHSIGGVG
jgi:hypothetical protein